jgi:hypothetical protein
MNSGNRGLDFVNPGVPIYSRMKRQISYWWTNGKANVRIGRLTAWTSGAGMEMTRGNFEESHTDFWTLQTQSPQKLTYSSGRNLGLVFP